MAKSFKHRYTEFSDKTVFNRVDDMINRKNALCADPETLKTLHVRITTGNRKTGVAVPSVSLIPVYTCSNCALCKNGCYDVRNVCFQASVKISRAVNTAILETDKKRYFDEIRKYLSKRRKKPVLFFRWHVGGDMVGRSYFLEVLKIAEEFPNIKFLIFTKLYGVVNNYLDQGNFLPSNLRLVFSDWRGSSFDNRHNLPVSSPVWFGQDGNETERGPHAAGGGAWCPGDCTACAETNTGCWNLAPGEKILFIAH